MYRRLISVGSLSGLLCVALGAFGAHALKEKLQPEQLGIFETAVRYQFYHSLAILATALLGEKTTLSRLTITGYFFIAGIFLFSGSLYLKVASYLFAPEPWKWLSAVTPFGGVCLMGGWLSMFLFINQKKSANQ